jgi:uncharacterized membrane protein YcaP (DUF421 family)
MSWLVGHWGGLGLVAAKAALMYATALFALRIGERRTLAQWTLIDFVTAVAVGAIVGRTATAGSQSYVVGAVALVTMVAVHRLASVLRFSRLFNKLVDHRVRVLVAAGELRRSELRRCGLTDNDLYTQLRQRGIFTLQGLRYVLYETKGTITVVREPEPDTEGEAPLVAAALDGATHFG